MTDKHSKTKNACELCGEKLENHDSDTMYYCLKCAKDSDK
jgi:predicted RNA-binding Zn-ribbon protein involved in translation (DUF1610 family)